MVLINLESRSNLLYTVDCIFVFIVSENVYESYFTWKSTLSGCELTTINGIMTWQNTHKIWTYNNYANGLYSDKYILSTLVTSKYK